MANLMPTLWRVKSSSTAFSNDSLEFLDINLSSLSHIYLTLSALVCIEDPEAHIQNKEIVLALRRILWIWKD